MSPELPGIYDAQGKALEICCIPDNKCGASRQGNGGNLRVKLQHAPGEIFGKYW